MDIVVRAFLAFIFIFLLTRLIGRRELSTLQPFDLLLLVVVGDLLQQGVTKTISFTGLLLAVGMFGLLTLALSYTGWRFPRLRPLLEPEPLILVEDGKVIERNLRKERITPEEVAGEARRVISSLDDVQWALLESGGRIVSSLKSPSQTRRMPLYPSEADVDALLTPADALTAIEACAARMAAGTVDNRLRHRHRLESGGVAVMSAVDHELARSGVKAHAAPPKRTSFVVTLFDLEQGRGGGRHRSRQAGAARPVPRAE